MENIKGFAEGGSHLTGKISKCEAYYTDAYRIAVANGFDGTVEEWLESLKGKDATEEQIAAAVAEYMKDKAAIAIGEVTLLANKWVGDESPYSQVVAIAGVTQNSQVDLTPSVEQLAVFHHKDLAFVTENEDGVVTVYAIGEKPMNDYTIQVTITEVQI